MNIFFIIKNSVNVICKVRKIKLRLNHRALFMSKSKLFVKLSISHLTNTKTLYSKGVFSLVCIQSKQNNYNQMKRIAILLAFLATSATALLAQNLSVKGTVYDFDSGDVLSPAAVQI